MYRVNKRRTEKEGRTNTDTLFDPTGRAFVDG